MSMLNGRRLISFVGMTILLGAVAFMAYGASIDCTDQRICVGTESDDSIVLDVDTDGAGDENRIVTRTIKGLGGDDNIVARSQGGDGGIDGTSDRLEEILGGAGDDRIQLLATTDSGAGDQGTGGVAIFGESGDDFIEIGRGGGDGGSERTVGATVNAGRGNDTVIVRAPRTDGGGGDTTGRQAGVINDGDGRDTILVEDLRDDGGATDGESAALTIRLSGDNEADTVRGSGDVNETIVLDRNSGRDVLTCGERRTDSEDFGTDGPRDNGMIILNGNRKAVDPQGNNLYRAAIEGGTALTGCDTILP